MSEAINAHKRMAMGISPGNKFKDGGAVMAESKAATLANDSSQKKPIIKSSGLKIATNKKGGRVR